MMGGWTAYLLMGVTLLSLVTGAGSIWYYRDKIKRMERILQDVQEQGQADFEIMKETRESRLENDLKRILEQAAAEREQAAWGRDQVTGLLSDLSHQLKTPMANVLMYTELLTGSAADGDEWRELAAEAHAQAEKMQWLLEDMLQASRLEQRELSFPAAFSSIRDTLGKTVSAVYARAADKAIAIVMEPFEDRRLYHNPKWTVEALENILDNAVKYSPAHTQITIRLQPMEIYSAIEIEDQGIGLDPAEYNDIFKRFYRGRRVEQAEGNGLGLYLAQLILNHEKGYITAGSRPGEGSCFRVFLLND